jgi:UDP-hydrolysing UDP-N-acetyl-D-glucosamine 2-epimerase
MRAIDTSHGTSIAVVTGSRADYGLLYTVMKAIKEHRNFNLKTIVTGMHLSPEFGNTHSIIADDGFTIDYSVECLLSGDSETAIAKSMGLGVIGFSDALQQLAPDLLLVLGDRFEIFSAVQTALILKIPVAHIAGGDVTEGAFDDSIRHSITKMSHLHFTTNPIATQRVLQLGENPQHVFTVGSPGVDLINNTVLLSRDELQSALNTCLRDKLFVVTFHPETLERADIEHQCKELLAALDHYVDRCSMLISKANADTGGRHINRLLQDYASKHDNVTMVASLGQQLYYSAIAHANVVIGNSSSGLYEAPTLKTATVNIGDRQKGRLRATSVVDCAIDTGKIIRAINAVLTMDCSEVVNPYGDGHATENIIKILKQYQDKTVLRSLVKKHFHTFTHVGTHVEH